ncbi:hypothetical protein AAG906_030049 [Vitis piasezkii]
MGAPKIRPTGASLCPCPAVQVAPLMRPLAVIAPVPLKSCIQTENLEGAEVAVLCITKSEEVLNHQAFTDAKGIYRLAGTMPESDRWDAMPSQVLFKSTVTRLGGYDKVTSSKLWRQVGESFKSPKTCTTVSWVFRGFYEKALLNYERHKTRGGELSVPVSSLA